MVDWTVDWMVDWSLHEKDRGFPGHEQERSLGRFEDVVRDGPGRDAGSHLRRSQGRHHHLEGRKKPPVNAAHPDVSVAEAVAWATASGIAVGLARMLASRKAADYYRRSTGHLPANLEDVTV
jgi:hypothetical protein